MPAVTCPNFAHYAQTLPERLLTDTAATKTGIEVRIQSARANRRLVGASFFEWNDFDARGIDEDTKRVGDDLVPIFGRMLVAHSRN
jgi:hypothetical protein